MFMQVFEIFIWKELWKSPELWWWSCDFDKASHRVSQQPLALLTLGRELRTTPLIVSEKWLPNVSWDFRGKQTVRREALKYQHNKLLASWAKVKLRCPFSSSSILQEMLDTCACSVLHFGIIPFISLIHGLPGVTWVRISKFKLLKLKGSGGVSA